MLIENPKLLDQFRKPGLCEICGQWFRVREPHHVRTKGACGGSIDIPINLISSGPTIFTKKARHRVCACHRHLQEYKIDPARVLSIIAARESCTPEDITEVMNLFVRMIKPTESQLLEALDTLSDSALRLAVRELRRAGKLQEIPV